MSQVSRSADDISFVRFEAQSARFVLDERAVSPGSVLSTRWLLAALEQTRPFARGRLLDVGCGTMPYREFFAAEQHIGIDWPNSPHRLQIDVAASAEAIPFADASFDTVLCSEVIEHLQHPARAVSEMARVLRPGGHLVLTAPFVHEIHEAPFDFFRYTPLGMQSLAREAGLEPCLLLCRGDLDTVLFDLASRRRLSFLRAVMRRVPGGGKLGRALVESLMIRRQRLAADRFIARAQRRWREHDDSEFPPRLSLGCVLVARK